MEEGRLCGKDHGNRSDGDGPWTRADGGRGGTGSNGRGDGLRERDAGAGRRARQARAKRRGAGRGQATGLYSDEQTSITHMHELVRTRAGMRWRCWTTGARGASGAREGVCERKVCGCVVGEGERECAGEREKREGKSQRLRLRPPSGIPVASTPSLLAPTSSDTSAMQPLPDDGAEDDRTHTTSAQRVPLPSPAAEPCRTRAAAVSRAPPLLCVPGPSNGCSPSISLTRTRTRILPSLAPPVLPVCLLSAAGPSQLPACARCPAPAPVLLCRLPARLLL